MAYAQQLPTSGIKESLTLCEEGEGRYKGVAQLSEPWVFDRLGEPWLKV